MFAELTDEGEQMWKNIAGRELTKPFKFVPVTTNAPAYYEELMHMTTQLLKMIENSENVIEDCNDIISTYKTEKEYLTSDAKVAKTIHMRFIERLNKILDGEEVFPDIQVEMPVIKPRTNSLYYKPKR